jgi:hypothetical protein
VPAFHQTGATPPRPKPNIDTGGEFPVRVVASASRHGWLDLASVGMTGAGGASMHDRDTFAPTEESIDRSRRSGWSAGETAWHVHVLIAKVHRGAIIIWPFPAAKRREPAVAARLWPVSSNGPVMWSTTLPFHCYSQAGNRHRRSHCVVCLITRRPQDPTIPDFKRCELCHDQYLAGGGPGTLDPAKEIPEGPVVALSLCSDRASVSPRGSRPAHRRSITSRGIIDSLETDCVGVLACPGPASRGAAR